MDWRREVLIVPDGGRIPFRLRKCAPKSLQDAE